MGIVLEPSDFVPKCRDKKEIEKIEKIFQEALAKTRRQKPP